MSELEARIRAAWQGRVCGCMLGKPVELLSMFEVTANEREMTIVSK